MPSKGIGLETEKNIQPLGQTHLLVIAIDAYQHCPPLYNCVKDAQDLIEVLTEKYRIEAENITSLFNEAATRDNIYHTFEKMVTSVRAPDNLLIYFSGHGEYNKNFRQGYWIPVEAQRGRPSQYIPNSEIRIFLSAIPAHHIFLMADSCFSGSLFSQGADRQISRRYEADPSRWGLTSGRNEIVSDGKPGDNSPFAESLLYRLRQNTDAISVQELCAHVVEFVQSNANQSPIGEPLKVSGHKNGQFVFHVRKHEGNDWVRARKEGTLAAYQYYLKSYPQGKHRTEAEQKVKKLQEALEWEKARVENSIFSYNRYLSSYTDGQFEVEARNALRKLEDDQSWQRAQKQGTLSAMYDYQDKHPQGQYIEAAKQQISTLLDSQREQSGQQLNKKVEPTSKIKATPQTATAKSSSIDKKNTGTSSSGISNQLKAIGGGILLILLFIIGKQITKLGSGNPQSKVNEPSSREASREDNGKQDLTTDFSSVGNQMEAAVDNASDEKTALQPLVSLAGFRGQANLANVKSNPALLVHCPDLGCNCEVKGFTLKRISTGKDLEVSFNAGAQLNDRSRQLVARSNTGDIFYFDNVKLACDGELLGKTVDDFAVRISKLGGIRIKSIPAAVKVGLPGLSPGTVEAQAFKKVLSLAAKKADCTSDCNCGVEYFSLTYQPAGGTPITVPNEGAFYKAETLKLIRKAATGDNYYFTGIQVKCGNTTSSNIQSFQFSIK